MKSRKMISESRLASHGLTLERGSLSAVSIRLGCRDNGAEQQVRLTGYVFFEAHKELSDRTQNLYVYLQSDLCQ